MGVLMGFIGSNKELWGIRRGRRQFCCMSRHLLSARYTWGFTDPEMGNMWRLYGWASVLGWAPFPTLLSQNFNLPLRIPGFVALMKYMATVLWPEDGPEAQSPLLGNFILRWVTQDIDWLGLPKTHDLKKSPVSAPWTPGADPSLILLKAGLLALPSVPGATPHPSDSCFDEG